MSNLGRFGDILGLILLPFITIGMMIISPVLLILMILNYRKGENE
jgi:hypothetical protein